MPYGAAHRARILEVRDRSYKFHPSLSVCPYFPPPVKKTAGAILDRFCLVEAFRAAYASH